MSRVVSHDRRSFNPLADLAGLSQLWQETAGDPRVVIAVIDGPADLAHPCFAGARVGWAAGAPTSPPIGRMSAHATHIASILFGQPQSNVRGVAPRCRGVLVPIFTDGAPTVASQQDLAHAIYAALAEGAHVINVSGGELSQGDGADPQLVRAVQACAEQGALIVAAAGNNACQCVHVPAALSSVLAVGAADMRGRPLDSSNWGDAYRTQGVLAPGEHIAGAEPGGGVTTRSGTSFATPLVAGVASLLLSVQLARGERPDPFVVRQAILASAIPCGGQAVVDCRRFLAGTLNIPGARAFLSKIGARSMLELSEHDESIRESAVNLSESLTISELEPSDASAHSLAPSGEPSATIEVASPPRPEGASAERHALPRERRAGVAASFGDDRGVEPSEGCHCKKESSKRFVFAIGAIGYDFGTEARRDGFKQLMPNVTPEGIPYVGGLELVDPPMLPSPYDPRQLVNYLAGFPAPSPPYPTEGGYPRLERQGDAFPPPITEAPSGYRGYPAHPSEAAELIWLLNIELTPVYAIRPTGDFSAEIYQRLVQSLAGQILHPAHEEFIDRVSISGCLTGETVRLYSGQVVPVITPQIRGFYSWNVNKLLETALAVASVDRETEEGEAIESNLDKFLNRIYYDLRNLGQTPQERALNFTATNVTQALTVFSRSLRNKMQLDSIQVERSAFCRMDSDCWDVKFKFFDPQNSRRARDVYRMTVDVSDVYPVSVGPVREWSVAG